MATDLSVLTNTDRRFYPLLGPFLARREVVKAVGGPIWDDDAKTWLVVTRGKQVLGFVAVAARGQRVVVESLYTQPGLHRVATELVGAAADRFEGRELWATVKRDQLQAFTAAGFKPVSETAGFVKVRKAASDG